MSESRFSGVMRKSLATSQIVSQPRFSGLVRKILAYVPPDPILIPVFPPLPVGFPVKISPTWDTTIGTTKSLREMRVPQRQMPLWDIEILFEELRDQTQNSTPYGPFSGFQQYEQLVQLWMMMYGQTGVFAFDCPWDDSRANQLIGVGDGSTYEFTIYRTWGLGAQEVGEPIGLINTIFEVYINGVLQSPTGYYTSNSRNRIYFLNTNGSPNPPGAGLNITMTFSFYYLCRFVSDEQDFEEFSKNRWAVSSLKFQSVNWP